MKINFTSSTRYLIKILSVYFLFILSFAFADDHNEDRHERINSSEFLSDHKKDHNEDTGNELTGKTTALIFVIANFSALLSLLSKGIIKFSPLKKSIKEKILVLNMIQKKHLSVLHYILNPIALIIASVHLILSQCLSTILPELGLALMFTIGVTGISVKFKISPKKIRNTIYRFHTNPIAFGFIVIILSIGHMIID
jgi:hypothetical protein